MRAGTAKINGKYQNRFFVCGLTLAKVFASAQKNGFFMEQQLYFQQLHEQLAQRYFISSHEVSALRTLAVGQKKTRKEIAEYLVIKLSQPHYNHRVDSRTNTRRRPKEHYQSMLNFVASCRDLGWEDMIQPTPFDKK